MKAISLHEPWGTAIRFGLKRYETRTWDFPRGLRWQRVAIHCSLTTISAIEVFQWPEYQAMREALAGVGVRSRADLSFGKIVAVVTLHDSIVITRDGRPLGRQISETERMFGNWEPGRVAWDLRDVTTLAVPVPFRGRQGFFEVPDSIIEEGLR